jgi:hypothetical protein
VNDADMTVVVEIVMFGNVPHVFVFCCCFFMLQVENK